MMRTSAFIRVVLALGMAVIGAVLASPIFMRLMQ